MELYDRSAWTGNDKISGNAPHAHKEGNSHFVHPWNAARQGKDRRGQIANRRSTVGGRWNEKNRPRRLFSCAPLVQGQPLSRLTPPAFLLLPEWSAALRSRARLRYTLRHWAYFALFRPQVASLASWNPRGARRPLLVAEIVPYKLSKASESRVSEPAPLECKVARWHGVSRDGGIDKGDARLARL